MGLIHFLGLSKHKVGLALGSGGVKGFAHIGLLKVLKQNNIPISCISGTSAGSLIGGLYLTHGQDPAELERIMQEVGTKEALTILSDFTLNGGLIKGDKVIEYINKLFKDINIEDLPMPFSVVTTNLKTGFPQIITSGNLAQAIRTSISVPLFFKPATYNNEYYIDGGVTIPVPIEPVRELGADKVIACCLDWDLFPIEILDKRGNFTINTIERTISIMVRDISRKACEEADVLIAPDFTSFTDPSNITNYNKRNEIMTLGEIATLKQIDKIKRLV